MRRLICISTMLLLLHAGAICGQEIRFNRILSASANNWAGITSMAQDDQGYIWFTTFSKGLQRYDGLKVSSFTNDLHNSNTVASGVLLCVSIDTDNMVWIGLLGSGLDRFDQVNNTFTHYRHDPKDRTSLSGDIVTSILEDHLGNLWVGTENGLNLLDRKTGKFTHFQSDSSDIGSISDNLISKIYEDKNGDLWIGCGDLLNLGIKEGQGGLNRFDRTTKKFKRFLPNPADAKTISGKMVGGIYEDKRGNFWIGSDGIGLQILDRKTGIFTQSGFDPAHPLKGSKYLPTKLQWKNRITFITEDASGALWVGCYNAGLSRCFPDSKKVTHYGFSDFNKVLNSSDTTSGLNDSQVWGGMISKDGLLWISTLTGNLFNLNFTQPKLPFFKMKQPEANSMYCEPNNRILWVATDAGLLRKDLETQAEKLWLNNPKDSNSLISNIINAIQIDDRGKIWVGTVEGGLDQFDPETGKFTHHLHNKDNPASISSNKINNLIKDHAGNIWAATDSGISKVDCATGRFTNYIHKAEDSNSITGVWVIALAEDRDHSIWAGTSNGISHLDTKTGKFRHYYIEKDARSFCIDSKGVVWAGLFDGLYYFDRKKDRFTLYGNEQSGVEIKEILGITEDDHKNLWLSCRSYIIKIGPDRKIARKFAEAQGVAYSRMGWCDNFKARDGRMFLGHWDGFFAFYPDKIGDKSISPTLTISSFRLGDKEIHVEPGSVLSEPIWKTKAIQLNHDQNNFSFDFQALDFVSPGDDKYLFKLENYDNTWHDIGTDHKAFFFNIPPGSYIFKVKVISGEGLSAEQKIEIMILPPWWKTWWAYCFYGAFVGLSGWGIFRFQRQRIVRDERLRTQQKELHQAKEIEKAYVELKATQTQLIQSEKMASLGELTAGIAHEIQNPLNFVNNFSEVSNELIEELKTEKAKAKSERDEALENEILDDISVNLEKILHHGKRADAIVKGMLQHSRSSSGQKEPTDINALCDEYLRLCYHGLRAKDKSFNASMETNFDKVVGNVNVIPQDIGRVILNLLTNAFYAVNEKKKSEPNPYEPTVSVTTQKLGDKLEIRVSDNGNGIPQKVLDKIFQPFFTTKPTGQGTGLGLSLSYDIITKGHGGELKVETKEGVGTIFIINLSIA